MVIVPCCSVYGALVAVVVIVEVVSEGVQDEGQGGPMAASIGSRHHAPRNHCCLRWSSKQYMLNVYYTHSVLRTCCL